MSNHIKSVSINGLHHAVLEVKVETAKPDTVGKAVTPSS